MRTAVTVAKKHTGEWVMLAHPDVPLADQNKIYRSFLLEKGHPDYCYVQLQESDGLFRRTHLRTMEAHAEHTATMEKQNKEAAEAGERERNREEQRRKGLVDDRAEQHKREIDRLNKLAEDQGSKNPAKPDKGATTTTTPSTPAPEEGGLKAGGPTMEDWVEAGFNPVGYPPEGFSEVDSPALQEFKATGKVTPRVAPAASASSEAPAAETSPATAQSAPAAESTPASAGSETPSTPAAKAEGETTNAATESK